MTSADAWLELIERLDRHRLRTALTMFSVAWGILMLVLLLAAGKGLENNVRWQFRDDAVNSVWMWPGRTSVLWEGHAVGRSLYFDNDDVTAIRALPGVVDAQGKTVGDLYDKTFTTMPATAPGSLTPAQAADIVSYMLSSSRFKAGTADLETKSDALQQIKIEAPK